ncbi:MAG: rRNA maturation RNase YbeY [Candidatus Marinimicrobia bacterium CG_4_10_14_0_2_um_filter_48_9]|nr:MAG: rRNA maturation RNase YbeY [Candidatus Marinimicrobia bacterium CG_4_10_14_0_2_um_filter_48_9]PJA53038.1 MAG: rRNA maturation RNase YbeY [Candidatus Marinimicrobia bacterium CG_4_9_14_3_um_filter_48_9]
MIFELLNESDSKAEIPDPEPLQQALETVLAGEKRVASSITIILLTNDALRAMKAEHFGMDWFTDIIAFNMNEANESEIEGELYLSPEQIRLNAGEYGVSFTQEFLRVVLHGCLHLCGYEDSTPTEKNQMRALEDKYLSALELGQH